MIEFVSPRPNEDEDGRGDEETNGAFYSMPGGTVTMMGGFNNYQQFSEIPEELKEEEDFDSDRNNDLEEYKKQLSSRKFKLF